MTHLNDISKVYLQNIASQETQEEGYKPIDKKKESAMYRRAGNLARTSLSSKGKKKEEAQDKSSKIVSAITRQKENERFAKMGDEKARDNYKEEVEQVDENVATGKARRAKFGGIAQRVGSGEAVSNQEKSDRFAKSVAAKKAALKAAGDAAHKSASDKGMSPAEAEMRRKAAERKAARAKKRQMGESYYDPMDDDDFDHDEAEKNRGVSGKNNPKGGKALGKKNKMKEALDPVGQEDGDVNNDGKKNKIDKYLMKRRKAIGKAIATRKEEIELDENRAAARAAGGYKDDSKKQTDPSKAGFTGISGNIEDIMRQNKEIEARNKANSRKEETEITEIHAQAHTPHEVPDKNLKGLVKKAVKRIDADVDGDVDTSDPKETEMGEFVPTADGKGKLKTKVQREGFSNWRQDLIEIITDDSEESKPIKEKKVKNKIVINPDLKESVEQLGGELISIEVVDLNEEELVEYVVDSLYEEFLEEGYSEDDIEEAIESAIQEATVTYGHDTRKPKSARQPEDRLGAVARLARAKIKKYAKKAVVGGARAVAKGATKLANKVERDNPNTFSGKKKDRSASTYRGQGVGRKEKVGSTSTAAPAATKTPKSSRSTSQRSQSAKTKTKRDKLDDLISSIRNEQLQFDEGSLKPGETYMQYAKRKAAEKSGAADKRMTVTAADKKANTPAYQNYKAGDKRYKMMGEGEQLDEKALSKAQQRFMGMVYAVKKGDMEAPSPEVAKAAASMTGKEAKDFAKTKHKGLPEKKEVKEGATEAAMSPQEIQLQKKKTQIDLMISRKRRQALDKQNKEGSVNESSEDRLRDQRMERGGVDGNTRYDRPPAKKATNAELGIKPGKTALQKAAEKKYGKGASAMDIVKADIRAKYGKGAIMDKK